MGTGEGRAGVEGQRRGDGRRSGEEEKRKGAVALPTERRHAGCPKQEQAMTNQRSAPGPCPTCLAPAPNVLSSDRALLLDRAPSPCPSPHLLPLVGILVPPTSHPHTPAFIHSLRRKDAGCASRYRQVPSFPASLHSDRTPLPPSILAPSPPPSSHILLLLSILDLPLAPPLDAPASTP